MSELLSPVGLALSDFAGATQGFLDEYARYALLALDNPSASWDGAVVELCKAVETELGHTLGECPGLRPLKEGTTLGEKAKRLRDPSPAAVSWLAARKWDAHQVKGTLASQVSKLANVRGRCGAAHGGLEGREAKKADHDQALKIALTGAGAILPMLVRLRKASTVRK